MKPAVEEAKENKFVPWLDSALLPEESEYAVVNKVAWFLAMSPIAFLRACKLPKQEVKIAPFTLDLNLRKYSCEQYLTNHRMTPVIYGKPMNEYLSGASRISREEIIGGWNAKGLRVCPECIAMGVHLKIHQHLAIDKCPVHNACLQTSCPRCARPLPGNWQGKQHAFCCEHCRASLLNQERIVIYHTNEFRQSVADSIQQFNQWKLRALLDQRVQCGANWETPDNEDLPAWCHQAMQLSAGVQSITTPSWVRHICHEGVDITFKTLDLNRDWRRAFTRGISGDVPTFIEKQRNADSSVKSTDDAMGSVLPQLCQGRFRSALRRVTSIFLSRYGPLHLDCLNTPHQMFGQQISWNNNPEDLLLCCPIAVGFWMWRNSSIETYRDMTDRTLHFEFTRARQANIDLLLYGIARSHLHYCICLAKHLIDKTLAPGACQLDEVIDPIEQGMRGECWSPLYFQPPRRSNLHFDIAGRAYYIHVDMSAVLRDIPCAGRQALDDRINKRLEPMRKLRELKPLRAPSTFTQRPRHPDKPLEPTPVRTPEPFRPTPNDYLFMSEVNDQMEDDQPVQPLWFLHAMGYKKKPILDRHSVLHTSINSKQGNPDHRRQTKRPRT